MCRRCEPLQLAENLFPKQFNCGARVLIIATLMWRPMTKHKKENTMRSLNKEILKTGVLQEELCVQSKEEDDIGEKEIIQQGFLKIYNLLYVGI